MPLSKRIIAASLIVAIIAALTFVVSPATPAYAATFEVTNTLDDANPGSFRWAVASSEASGATNTITFNAATFSTPQTIQLTNALPTIDGSDLTIIGNGNVTIRGEGAADPYSIFYVAPNGSLTIENMILSNGGGATCSQGRCGGAIYATNTVVIRNSVLTGSTANAGGGLYTTDQAIISGSTISGNSANNGAGIYAFAPTRPTTIFNSTINNNTTTGVGGGIYLQNSVANITNSTITGNFASNGGGIGEDQSRANITNSTITGNTANGAGGGMYFDFSINRNDVRNSIIAGNNAAASADLTGPLDVDSNNITSGDPLLGALANNGGSTQTMLPQAGSPAINAGDSSFLSEATTGLDYNGDGDTVDTLSLDQRGATRAVGSAVDIGAVEVQIATANVVSSVRASPNLTNVASVDFTVTFSAPVTGITTANFETFITGGISGASVTNVSGSGTTYTVTVNTGSGDGTLRLEVANDSGLDSDLTNLPFTSGEAYTIDKTAPTVTINQAAGQSDPTATLPIRFDVVFSEAVSGFVDAADVSLAASTADVSTATINIIGSGAVYTVEVSGVASTGTVVASVVAGAASDGVSNISAASTSTDNSVTYDPGVPSATITRTDPNPTTAAFVRYTVTFSQDVSGVDTDPSTQTDFEVITSGTLSGVAITEITGSAAVYMVTTSTGTGTGTIRLNLNDNDSITNSLTIPLGGAGNDNGDVIGPEYTIRLPQPVAQPAFPTPQPVPLCTLLGGGTNSIVRASVPSGLNADVFCRILNENGVYVRNAAEVGDPTLINAGILQAVDVFGFSAGGVQVAAFNQSIRVCLQGSGRLFFRDATSAPRVTVPLIAASEGSYTCGSIPNAGTVVLVR
jgi:hypothetical protein